MVQHRDPPGGDQDPRSREEPQAPEASPEVSEETTAREDVLTESTPEPPFPEEPGSSPGEDSSESTSPGPDEAPLEEPSEGDAPPEDDPEEPRADLPSSRKKKYPQQGGRWKRILLDHGLPLLLSAAFLALLIPASRDTGFSRDEGFYFTAAESYNRWFTELFKSFGEGEFTRAFGDDVIRKYWEVNHEHPALVKTLMALSYRWLHKGLGVEATLSFRLPGMISWALLIWLTHALGLLLWNRRVALVGALCWALMPRYFFHGQMACFDVPVALAWVATTYCYLRSLDSRRWAVLTGVAFGLAMATKHNVLFLPVILVVHLLLSRSGEIRLHRRGRDVRVSLPAIPLSFITMALIGPLVFYLHWPYIWHDTFDRVGWYLNFHMRHVHYPTLYLGDLLLKPPFPFHFPFVMTGVTMPLPMVTLALVGMGLTLRRGLARSLGGRWPLLGSLPPSRMDGFLGGEWFILLNILVPILVIALPSVPIFGGVKHWSNSMPYLALMAAVGLDHLTRSLEERLRAPALRVALAVALALLLLVPSALSVRYSHPYGMSFYSSLIGGMRGAMEVGMQRQWWGYSSSGSLAWINSHAPHRCRIYWHDSTYDVFKAYQRSGRLRKDLRLGGSPDLADMAVLHYMKETMDTWFHAWRIYKSSTAVTGSYIDEVPLVQVFQRGGPKKKR